MVKLKRQPRKVVRRSMLFFAAAVLICQAVAGLAAPLSQAEGPFGPGYRACGSFHAHYRIKVYSRHLRCRRAMRIQREYWLAPPSRTVEVNHGGRPYVLLKRFPGWKCFSGAGGGTCNKGRKVAAYTDV